MSQVMCEREGERGECSARLSNARASNTGEYHTGEHNADGITR